VVFLYIGLFKMYNVIYLSMVRDLLNNFNDKVHIFKTKYEII